MRVLKWLFQPVYLLLIIVIVALYVNREALFSDEVAESLEAEALVGKVDELVERLSAETPLETSVAITPEPEVSESLDAPLEVAESGTVTEVSEKVALPSVEAPATPVTEETLPVTEEPAHVAEEPAPVAEVAPVVSSEFQSTTSEDEVVEVIEEEAPEAVTVVPAETQSVPEPLPEGTAETSVVSPLDTWRAARAAVWQGDLNGAVAQYRQLIVQQPKNYDAYGEMGNVLLAQSEVSAAVEAYVAAARLIHQSGNQRMAHRLVGVVATLDEAQGRALYNEFNQ